MNSLSPQALRLLLVAVSVLFSPVSMAETEKLDLPGARVETYKRASGDDLLLYLFTPDDRGLSESDSPAIVFFFGGGWNGGTPAQFEQHARYLASRGMVAALADYRVKSRQGTTPRDCVADGKSAVRWLRANASRLGIDPHRIAAGGGSAGGHVAAAAGIVPGLDDPADPHSEVSSKADALVLFNPVYDNGPAGFGHDRVKKWFPQISPSHNLTGDDPPAIVFLGTSDNLIPVATAEKFQADMTALDLKSELHLYDGMPHGFFNEAKGGTETFSDTVRKMDAFLASIGYLEGEPDEEALESVSRGRSGPSR